MAITEAVTISWGSRLGGSIKGILFGLLLFIAGFPVLFCNEGRSVKTAKAIDEGEGACVAVESNAAVDPDMNGRLVHMTGRADTKDLLEDDAFGVSATAIRLEREVEMFQWEEEETTTETKKVGGSVERKTTYSYKKDWSSSVIDSSDFHVQGHDNPGAMEFQPERKQASTVTFGAFRLNKRQIDGIGAGQALQFPSDFTCRVARVQVRGATIYVPNAETRGNALNNRDVSAQPRIGDMRVTFRVVYPHDVSIIAKQHGDTFVEYTAKNGRKLSYVRDGIADAAEMFESARSSNAAMTWILRLVGFLLMFFGLSMVLKPLSVLADVLPLLGDIVGVGLGIVAFIVALACALTTIAVAWIFYRPILGCVLLAAAGLLVWKLAQKRRAARAAGAATAA